MRLTEYIKHLESVLAENGDLEVFQGAPNTTLGGISPVRPARVKEIAKLTGKQKNPHYKVLDADEGTGRMIVYVGR